jgi:hypothetical protein
VDDLDALSDAMFPTPQANAHATEYLEDKGAQWGYAGCGETYTAPIPGAKLQTGRGRT